MILKKNNRDNYGITYQGSKTAIIPKIAKYFPNADHFYDLFGGGFSVTHYMAQNRTKSFKQFHYNEIRTGMCEFIKDAISGKYNYDNFKPEWITRERFHAEKETNAYIKILWSFGSSGKEYIFGEHIEQQKRSMHQAVVFDEFDEWFRDTFKISKWPNKLTITGKRLYLKKLLTSLVNDERLQQLERLQRLQRLQQLEQLQRLEQLITFTNLSYEQVEIKPNSVIYCDIPYLGTADYGGSFSHQKFFDWADAQSNPVFVSEYNIDDHRFMLLKEFPHRSTLAVGENKKVIERLYGNTKANKIIEEARGR